MTLTLVHGEIYNLLDILENIPVEVRPKFYIITEDHILVETNIRVMDRSQAVYSEIPAGSRWKYCELPEGIKIFTFTGCGNLEDNSAFTPHLVNIGLLNSNLLSEAKELAKKVRETTGGISFGRIDLSLDNLKTSSPEIKDVIIPEIVGGANGQNEFASDKIKPTLREVDLTLIMRASEHDIMASFIRDGLRKTFLNQGVNLTVDLYLVMFLIGEDVTVVRSSKSAIIQNAWIITKPVTHLNSKAVEYAHLLDYSFNPAIDIFTPTVMLFHDDNIPEDCVETFNYNSLTEDEEDTELISITYGNIRTMPQLDRLINTIYTEVKNVFI